MGLEQALIATQRSTPGGLAPDVDRLVARLRARWTTEAALRSFADDLDDATGDLIAAALILGSRRRGAGLSTVLAGLSESVAAEVRVRRQIEADRAKPRSTARRITLITLGVLGALFLLNPTYVAPYGTPVGQLTLVLLLAAYAGALLWLRRAAEDRPMPRILGAQVSREVQR
jgi:Flp pilus assembly protein TadB